MGGLWAVAADAFDRKLDRHSAATIAVAFSGGGDSLAALIATRAWARSAGRPVLAISVDHRLQPRSHDWMQFAEAVSHRLGVGFRALAWEDGKPAAGLPAAARAARHRLVAEAARTAGARVTVFGHTADDVLEGELMRADGSSLGRPREWTPSPAWPEGRGMFILRPLLGVRRAAIREALEACGETWIDDPANDDPRYARARARARLSDGGEPPAPPVEDDELARLAAAALVGAAGCIRLDRAALGGASALAARRLLSAALVSVAGGVRPPRTARLDGLLTRLRGTADVSATLAGARIAAREGQVLIARDAGQARREGLSPLRLGAGEGAVWDGRFGLRSNRDGCEVDLLAGRAARLDAGERRALAGLPAIARPALPAVARPSGQVSCPILATTGEIELWPLVKQRFMAACGTVSKEGAA
jgi:tRNA(Ile)-lysidine synthase